MSKTTIIELSQASADRVDQNGIYHVTLAEPYVIMPSNLMQTELAVRMVSINAPQQSQDTIIIEDDEPVTFSFSYYDVDYEIGDKKVKDKSVQWQNGTNPTFDYYTAYNTKPSSAGITDMKLDILGYYKGIDDKGKAKFGEPGGSYIIPLPLVPGGRWSQNIDPKIGFVATFSYLDSKGDLKTFKCTCWQNCFEQKLDNPGVGVPPYIYGILDGSACSLIAQQPLEDGQLALIPINDDETQMVLFPTDVTAGTVKLVNTKGGWAGGVLSLAKQKTFTFASDKFGGGSTPANIKPPIEVNVDLDADGKPEEPFIPLSFGNLDVTYDSPVDKIQLDVQTGSFLLSSGRYDSKALAVKLTQLINNSQGIKPAVAGDQQYVPENPLLTRTDTPENVNMFFRRVDIKQGDVCGNVVMDNSNSYVYAEQASNNPVPVILGAQQFSLEYGNAGNAFQVSYAHTPFQETGKANQQMAGIFTTGAVGTGDLRYYSVTTATGIVFHDLLPRSLWNDQLALSDKLTVPLYQDDSGLSYYDADTFQDKITEGFLGLDAFPIPATGAGANWRKQEIPPTNNPTYLDITGASKAIIGDTPQRDIDGGIYYIELIGCFRRRGGYIDGEQNRHQISMVASAQYQNNDIVTAYADSGIPYVHEGGGYVLSDVYVRILSGTEKTPVVGLGSQNSVFLQINETPIPQTQPTNTKDEKHDPQHIKS